MNRLRRPGNHAPARERGQIVVLFALLLPVFLGLGGIVIGVGNWYTHAKHLQTKADAGAFAGGGSWAFPCGPQIDARIEAQARLYAGSNNPQVGGVPDSSIHTVLNGSDWYDDDSNPAPTEKNDPANPSICDAKILDVKVTEDNSFPLFSLLPFFPDIKRKARVRIEEAEGIGGVLPIAVRAPEPVSAAAVFYDEANGNILAVKYFVKDNGISGLPGGLQGWSTYNPQDPSTWAVVTQQARTGVVIAVSFRGACDTSLPAGITKQAAPCFEDGVGASPFANVNALCNQGGVTQVVNCYWASGNWPSETVQSGLLFINGFTEGDAGSGPPALRRVYLGNPSSGCRAYFTAGTGSCTATVSATIDIGSYDPDGPGGPQPETRSAANTEVRYRIVSDAGTFCAFTTPNCDLSGSGGPGDTSWQTTNTLPTFSSSSRRNSIVIRVRLRRTTVGSTSCGNNYSATCQWFFTANGRSTTAPTDAQALAAPVQRSFRGNSLYSSSIQWLRLTGTAGPSCGSGTIYQDNEAGSWEAGTTNCFVVDMGLKGGIAKDADEPPILFNDGTGPSQMGSVDCDPNIPQGQILIDGVNQGCAPFYAKNNFAYSPVCPPANQIFTQPNPGPPWNADWPPLRCVKTRPTGTMNQIERGLDLRLFGNQNQSTCPPDAAGFVKGRNYWDQDTNPLNQRQYGYEDDNPARDTLFAPNDPRLVTIFLAPTEAFASSGQNTYPITGFIEVYITGYGRIQGNGSLSVDDPCPGNDPPSDLDLSGGSAGGYAVWGHILNYVIPSPNATPSGVLCNPGQSAQPCVATLVE